MIRFGFWFDWFDFCPALSRCAIVLLGECQQSALYAKSCLTVSSGESFTVFNRGPDWKYFRGPDWKGGNADGLLGGSGEGTVTKVLSMSDHQEPDERENFLSFPNLKS